MTLISSGQTRPAGGHGDVRGRNLLVASVLFGLAGGLLEVGIDAVRLSWLKENLLLSPQFVWMIPAVSVGLCLGLGLFLLCAVYVLPRVLSPKRLILFIASLGLAGPMFAIPRLHWAAALLLIAGIGWRTASFIAARLERFLALLPRAVAALAVIVLILALGVNSWMALEERHALAALPPAPANAPNVLLIVLDTVRAESLSLYGYTKPTTPQLERLAAGGTIFNHAISASPWTLPSHATMFTGHFPHELSADWKSPLDNTYPTIAEFLQSHGYVTAGFVANLIYGSTVHGLNRGFIHYRDFPVSLGQALLNSSIGSMVSSRNRFRYWLDYHRVLNRPTAAEVNESLLSWISENDQRPFFAFLNYMDAHEPYLPPASFEKQFGPPRKRVKFEHSPIDAFRPAMWDLPPQEVQTERAQYEAAIAYMDDELGHLVRELGARKQLRNTLLIIVGDHGEQLGEHKLFGHGNSLYRPLLEVPLLIYFPDHIPAGTTVREPVSLRDIAATVLDLVGLDAPAPFPGNSLTRYLKEPDEKHRSEDEMILSEASKRTFGVQSWTPLGKGDMKSLVAGGYHYIWNSTGNEELYNFEKDSAEVLNLSKSEEGLQVIKRFRESLAILPARSSTSP